MNSALRDDKGFFVCGNNIKDFSTTTSESLVKDKELTWDKKHTRKLCSQSCSVLVGIHLA